MISAVLQDRRKWQAVALAFSSVTTVALLFWLQGYLGFNFWDEGFLWYGTQRVMVGEIPIRDFMAYDPGRYYWSAAIMTLMRDNGIIANRVAVAMFQTVGLFLGLILLARNCPREAIVPLLLAAGTFVVWMFPRHKLFDITVSLSLVAILTFLIREPSRHRLFLTGFLVGLVAIVGRNHGVYGVLGSISALMYVSMKRDDSAFIPKFQWWLGGVIAGYTPMIVCLIVVPGFAWAFWESIAFLWEYKGTNLPLPIPWPWRVDYQQYWVDVACDALVGAFFVAVFVFTVVNIGVLVRSTIKNTIVSPVFAAAVLMALPYAHFAFSRADVGHLGQGIFPFLTGVLVLLLGSSPAVATTGTAILFATSLVVTLPQHPAWQFYRAGNWLNITIAGDKLIVDPSTASDVALLSNLVENHAPDGRAFVVTPYWPGAYAAFARESPMWEIYALFPRSTAFQEREIQRIKRANPGFALVIDRALDGREELRFRNTHPLIDRYIRMNYDPLDDLDKRGGFQIYVNNRLGQ